MVYISIYIFVHIEITRISGSKRNANYEPKYCDCCVKCLLMVHSLATVSESIQVTARAEMTWSVANVTCGHRELELI